MLQVNFIKQNKAAVIERLKKRMLSDDDLNIVEQVIVLDDQRKHIQTELDALLAERNTLSAEIGKLFKTGKQAEAAESKAKVAALKITSEENQ